LFAAGGAFFVLGGAQASAASSSTGDGLADDATRYARVGMALVLADGVRIEDVANRLPLVRDAALSVMSGLTAAELRGTDAIEQLRLELSGRVADLYRDDDGTTPVLRVVLTDLLIQ
jgi:flagellar basal body-associated protein FliL